MTALTLTPYLQSEAPKGLTYGEQLLVDGCLDDGMIMGLSGSKDALRTARKVYASYRAARGYKAAAADMLTKPDAQAKLGKSQRYALGLMLTPARSLDHVLAGLPRPVNACPLASIGCAAACLSQSGHGQFCATQYARQVRHGFLLSHPFAAGVLIGHEIRKAREAHGPDAVTFRFNVVSDYRIERIIPRSLMALRTMEVRAYDYTAWSPKQRQEVFGYHLTYSAKETAHTSDAYLADILRGGHNVAMPFHGDELPSAYSLDGELFAVIDGDKSDDRTEDGVSGVIVGLKAKGSKGKKDASGFIRPLQ